MVISPRTPHPINQYFNSKSPLKPIIFHDLETGTENINPLNQNP